MGPKKAKPFLIAAPIAGVVVGLLLAICLDTPDAQNGGVLDSVLDNAMRTSSSTLDSSQRALQETRQTATDSPMPGPLDLEGQYGFGDKEGHKIYNLLNTRHVRFSNLWQNDAFEQQFFEDADAMVYMMICMFATILFILCMVNILSVYVIPHFAPAFNDLDTFGQMAVTTNLTYSLLLIFQLIPYTVLIIGILFGDSRARDYPTFTYAVFVFLTTHAVMYTYEGIARGIVKVNYLLLIHHAGFFIFCILDFIIQTNFVVKVGLIFDYFVVWEFGLYFTNVLYRLKADYTTLKWVMIMGTTVHGVTHFIQAMLLTAFFVGMGQRMERYHINKGVFALYVILSYSLIVYQFYLEKIFYEMWIKIAARHKKEQQQAAADVEEGKKAAAAADANGEVVGEEDVGIEAVFPSAMSQLHKSKSRGKRHNDGLSPEDWAQTED